MPSFYIIESQFLTVLKPDHTAIMLCPKPHPTNALKLAQPLVTSVDCQSIITIIVTVGTKTNRYLLITGHLMYILVFLERDQSQ